MNISFIQGEITIRTTAVTSAFHMMKNSKYILIQGQESLFVQYNDYNFELPAAFVGTGYQHDYTTVMTVPVPPWDDVLYMYNPMDEDIVYPLLGKCRSLLKKHRYLQ